MDILLKEVKIESISPIIIATGGITTYYLCGCDSIA
jgi:hypothetical protein